MTDADRTTDRTSETQQSRAAPPPVLPIGLDLGAAQVVDQLQDSLQHRFESRMIGGEIQASNTANFSSGVITLATITAYPAPGVLNSLSFSNSTAYRYYRYLGPANSYCDIAALQFESAGRPGRAARQAAD